MRRSSLVLILAAFAALLFCISCGDSRQGLTPVQPAQLTMTPASATVRAGDTQQFTATLTGSSAVVTFSVNGVAGGNSSVGTISASGLFTAPAALPSPATVTITANAASVSATASVALQNPIPVVSAVSPTLVGVGTV